MTIKAMRRLSLAIAAIAVVYAAAPAAHGAAPKPPNPTPPPPSYGAISVCSVSGARPITNTLSYTVAAPASAGGTQTINVAVGTCATQIFFPQGTTLTVAENVPTGFSVTSIALADGGASLSSSTPTAGTAVVLIGTSLATLTFTTSGPPLAPAVAKDCKVPNLLGLGLTGAKAGLAKAGCTLGRIRRAYSASFRVGRVMAEAPRRGTVLAPHAPVDLTLSKGPKP